jgi:hypothetical protein
MKIVVTLVFITFGSLRALSQEEYIRWSKNVKINWTDFKGKPDTYSPFAAMSAVGMYYKFNSVSIGETYHVRFEIDSRFDKSRSWSKRNLRTAKMLRHEQLHFDICELFSRKFKKEAENKVYDKNYRNEISSLFNRYTDELQKMQHKYDGETMHSTNKAKQKIWEELIHQQLLDD